MEEFNLRHNYYLCPYEGCKRSETGNGFKTRSTLDIHKATYEGEKNIANDLYLCLE
jgi:hypothetical protein